MSAHRMLLVIIYDVVEDRRRTRMHALLKQYGVPVQKSAFEAKLTDRELASMVRMAAKLIDKATDSLVVYRIASPQEKEIIAIGLPRPEIVEEEYFIV